MKRRTFLKGGAVAGATTLVAAPAIAQSTPEIKWRLTSSFPKSLDTIYGTAQTFAKYVADATDNKFQIQTFAAGEIVPGLQALDAVSSATVEMAKYYYFPGWWEGGAMLHMIVNDEKWNSLPKHYQAIVNQAAGAAGAWMIEKYDSVNPAALKRLVAGGAELRAFPQPVMEACYKATQDHLNEIAEKSPLFKKTKESHDAYMKEVLFYTQIAENYYDNYLLGKMRKG